MIANSATEHSWPKTAAGTVDWEYVFEDPGTGLLGLVGQAASPAALRECAILIIAKLYARKDDPAEVERFTKEISALIPDDMAADNLAEINTVVIGLLRQIKDSRIQKAAEHEAMRAAAETEEGAGRRAGDNAKSGRSTGKDRRKPDPMTTSPPSSARANKPNRNVLYAALTAAAAVAVVITFVVLEILEPPPEETQVEILIRQIQQAPAGKGPKTHSFGGGLRAAKNAGKMTVTADDVPLEACFDVAWGLVNRGRVTINGFYSRKLSPEIIRNLCTKKGGPASVTFMPKK